MPTETNMLQQTTLTDSRAVYPTLRDKRVIITGGASGIGAGLVEAFVAQGAHVAFVDIADGEAETLATRLSSNAVHPPSITAATSPTSTRSRR